MNQLRRKAITEGRLIPVHPHGIVAYPIGGIVNPLTPEQLEKRGYHEAARVKRATFAIMTPFGWIRR